MFSSFAWIEQPVQCLHYSLFVLEVFFKGLHILVVLLREMVKVRRNASETLAHRKDMLGHSCYNAASDTLLKYQKVVTSHIIF